MNSSCRASGFAVAHINNDHHLSSYLGAESSVQEHSQTTTIITTKSNGLNKANNNINNLHHHHQSSTSVTTPLPHQEEQLKQKKLFGLNGFVKTITNSAVNYVQNTTSSADKAMKGSSSGGGSSDTQNNNVGYVDTTTSDLETPAMLKKVNNLKLQPPSPAYDRYPKVGTMKVYPITTPDRVEPNKLDNNTQIIQVIQSSCLL